MDFYEGFGLQYGGLFDNIWPPFQGGRRAWPAFPFNSERCVKMKTFMAKPQNIKRSWVLIDASEKTLGRLATEIARILMGKNKAEYTPHADTGDFVVIINADKVRVTGQKSSQKMYYHHTGYPGGIRSRVFKDMIDKKPEAVIEIAVRGMLPKNARGRAMYKKLKVYAGAEHPHQAQQPQAISV